MAKRAADLDLEPETPAAKASELELEPEMDLVRPKQDPAKTEDFWAGAKKKLGDWWNAPPVPVIDVRQGENVDSAARRVAIQEGVSKPMAALQGITGGLADEAVAKLRGESPEAWRRLFEQAEERAPGYEVAGTAALMPIPGAVGRGFASRALSGAAINAAQGELSGFGHSAKHGLDAAKEGLPTAGVSALLGGAGGLATGPWGRTADNMAMRALGTRGGITNQMKNMGLETGDDVAALGRSIREEGLIGPLDTPGDIAKNASAATDAAGRQAGTALATADRMGAANPTRAQAAALQPLRTFRHGGSTPENAAAQGGKLREFSEQLAMEEPTFKALNANKSAAWKSANMKDEAPIAAQLYRKGVGKVRDDIEAQVREVAGDPVADALKEANRKFGVSADAYNLASDADTRDAHKWIVPSLLGAGGASAAAGQSGLGAGAALTALAAHLAKTRGPALMTNIAGGAERLGLEGANAAGNLSRGGGGLAEYLRHLRSEEEP